MDIARLSMGLAQMNTLQDVGTAVLNKAMDTQEMAGDGIMKMMNSSAAAMELSVNPHIGGNFDMSV